jgi:hypothetical protein
VVVRLEDEGYALPKRLVIELDSIGVEPGHRQPSGERS